MTDSTNQPPGYYQAAGDPPGTQRYWNGVEWVGDPHPVPGWGPVPGGAEPGYSAAGIPGGHELAGVGARMLARAIDLGIGFALGALVFLPFGGLEYIQDVIDVISQTLDSGQQFDQSDLPTPPSAFPGFIVGLLWLGAQIALVALKGATIGKLALGLRIIRQDDGTIPPGWRPAVMRHLVAAVSAFTSVVPVIGQLVGCIAIIVGLASVVMLFADSQRRTVMDFVASTFVVKSR